MTAETDSSPATGRPDALASLPRLDRHRPKGPPVRRSRVSRRRAAVLIAVHVVIGLHVWHWLATGESVTPVEPSEAMQTVELGRINAGFVLFAALIASTLVFGRWFCGWACHVVALQDLSAWLLGRAGLKPKPVRSRLLALAPWVVGGYMFVWPVVLAWWWPDEKVLPSPSDWRWELTTADLWATFPGPLMAVLTLVVVGFLVVWWLGAKGFCTYGCPYGAFFATADRVAPTRIVVDKDRCEACGHCTSTCSSNVRVHEEVARYGRVVDPGCMKCLDCVSVCPNDALSVGFAPPKPFVLSQQRIGARADFRWWEEALLAAVAWSATVWAFRGAWFGEGVPLLLAVGLGVITAVLALLLVRLLSRPDVTFQYARLKRAGRRTAAGTAALVLVVGWLLFTAHTFIGQRLHEGAVAAAQKPVQARMYAPRRFDEQAARAALADVDAAASWQLMVDPQLREVRALLRGALGRHADAEAELTALHDERGRLLLIEGRLALANYLTRRGRLADAEQLLLDVLSIDGDNVVAPVLLQQVRAQRGR